MATKDQLAEAKGFRDGLNNLPKNPPHGNAPAYHRGYDLAKKRREAAKKEVKK